MSPFRWALIQKDWCAYKKRKCGHTEIPGVRPHREKTIEKMTVYKPRTEASEETHPADPLSLDFQPPELGKNEFLSF